MAGDWVQMRCDLEEDPSVIHIATAVGIAPDWVVGKLHNLWSWANKHTTNGNVTVTCQWIDTRVKCDGFAKAMIEAGWLKEVARGILFPNFKRWNGKCAKQRALTAKRVARHRERKRNGDVTNVTQLEQRRAEESRGEALCMGSKRTGGVQGGKSGKGRWALKDLSTDELKDTPKLLARWGNLFRAKFQPASAQAPLKDSQVNRETFLGFAALALAEGRDPPRLFRSLVEEWNISKITNGYADQAAKRLKSAGVS